MEVAWYGVSESKNVEEDVPVETFPSVGYQIVSGAKRASVQEHSPT